MIVWLVSAVACLWWGEDLLRGIDRLNLLKRISVAVQSAVGSALE